MKIFILVMSLFTSMGVHAGYEQREINFNYIRQPSINENLDSSILVSQLTLQLASLGLDSLALGPGFPFNEMFSTHNMDKSVTVKLGYGIDDESWSNKLVKVGGDFLFHSKTQGGMSYALFFQGLDDNEVAKIVHAVHSNFTVKATKNKNNTVVKSVFNFMISTAHAEEEDCEVDGSPSGSGKLINLVSPFYNIIDRASSNLGNNPGTRCMVGVVKGMWDQTGGTATLVASGFANLFLHPVQSAQAVVNAAKNLSTGIRNFVRDVDGALISAYKNISSLPPAVKSEIACRIMANLGTGAVMTYFTAGSAAPVVMLKIAQLLRSLENSSQFGRVLGPLKLSSAASGSAVRAARRHRDFTRQTGPTR